MSKLSDVMKILRSTNFAIPLDKEGQTKYVVRSVDTDNFTDLPEPFIKQLKDEGKYGYYVSFCTTDAIYSYKYLPIYGSSDHYVTKWLYESPEDCINHDLRDKWMAIYERIMDFEENRQYIME